MQTVNDAEHFLPRDPDKLAFVTQTTLSVDDTSTDGRWSGSSDRAIRRQ